MSLYEECKPFFDPQTGLMTAGMSRGTDNLILMSAYLWRELLRVDGIVPDEFAHNVFDFICATSIEPGLNIRKPGDTDSQSVDNLIGLCHLSKEDAKLVRLRWNSYFGCFDVNNPNKIAINKNCFARFLGLKSFIVACAGLKPWWIQRIIWCLAVVFSVHTSKGASDPLLLSLQCDIMERYCPRTVGYWKRHYNKKALYSDFFGPNHPMTKYASESF